MVYVSVPKRKWKEVVDKLPTGMWAWATVTQGSWGVEADPWEPRERVWRAEDVLRDIRAAMKKTRH